MSMHALGETRSRRAHDHLLQTPDTFVWAPLPGMVNATACVHAAPAIGAGFLQYTARLEPAGSLGATTGSRFVYVTEGEVQFDSATKKSLLKSGSFCVIPNDGPHTLTAVGGPARCTVIEKPFAQLDGTSPPEAIIGEAAAISSTPLLGDDRLQVRTLIPDSAGYDFAVNTMTYQPGATLSMVEVHVMEHGLLMLEGEGVYRLSDAWYPVSAGDFIWMAPFCPQWFGALGPTPTTYLIYKDWQRHPLARTPTR